MVDTFVPHYGIRGIQSFYNCELHAVPMRRIIDDGYVRPLRPAHLR
ncbi:hypothetical protein A2U01_0115585, partial [Trifolium medium]|nr:hypothetical protein [Trifolium medium]